MGSHPHARRVDGLLLLSGVGPRQRGQKQVPCVELDEDGNILSYDFESQCHAVFQNVRYIFKRSRCPLGGPRGHDRIPDQHAGRQYLLT